MTTPESAEGPTPVGDLSYTEASRELDAIVGFFEHREVDVDQLVVRLERATAIVDELDRRVRKTRAQVEELVPRLESVHRDLDVETGEDELDEPDDGDAIDEHEMTDESAGATDGEDDEEQALF
jgi:exonuclease VII small subunit